MHAEWCCLLDLFRTYILILLASKIFLVSFLWVCFIIEDEIHSTKFKNNNVIGVNWFSALCYLLTRIHVPFNLHKILRPFLQNFTLLILYDKPLSPMDPKRIMYSTFGHLNSLTWFTLPCLSASGGKLAYFRKAAAWPRHQLSPSKTGRLRK